MIPQVNILITKFPYHSRLSGVEKHTFQIVRHFQGRECKFFLMSSCSVMLSEFKKRGWNAKRWWLGLPPVNRFTKILFVLTWPAVEIMGLIGLVYFKRKYNTQKLYCLTLADKLILTPLARVLGYEVIWLEHLSLDPIVTKNVFKTVYKIYSRFVKIIAISNFVRNQLAEMGIKNVEVIYHGVNIDQYYKQADIFEAMAEKRFAFERKNTFRIGCVSRLESLRGLEYLIKAVAILRKEFDDIDLVIVGEGSQREHLQWVAEQLGVDNDVKFVGYKDNFVDWICDFDVFVLPSLRESLGLILVEALAYGRPVIATNIGGIPEIIENNIGGVLVEPQNPRALANAIYTLKRDPIRARELARAGREKIIEQFSLNKMLEEYKKILVG